MVALDKRAGNVVLIKMHHEEKLPGIFNIVTGIMTRFGDGILLTIEPDNNFYVINELICCPNVKRCSKLTPSGLQRVRKRHKHIVLYKHSGTSFLVESKHVAKLVNDVLSDSNRTERCAVYMNPMGGSFVDNSNKLSSIELQKLKMYISGQKKQGTPVQPISDVISVAEANKGSMHLPNVRGKQADTIEYSTLPAHGDNYSRPLVQEDKFSIQASDDTDNDMAPIAVNHSSVEYYNSAYGRSVPMHDRHAGTPNSSGGHYRLPSPRREDSAAPSSPYNYTPPAGMLGPTESRSRGWPRIEPRHPTYRDEGTRRRSFAAWQSAVQQNFDEMAKSGLFCTGDGDLVRCFQCGIGLKDWRAHDDCRLEHLKHSPACQFLPETLEPRILQQYKDMIANIQQQGQSHGSARSTSAAAMSQQNEVCYHPEYREHRVRVSSFAKWPPGHIQTPQVLAMAGFYYTGFQDAVRCYACDGGLQRWDPEDDPWIEHARWFPQCSHLRSLKGEDFIQLVQLSLGGGSQDEDTGEADLVNEMNTLQIYNDPVTGPPARESEDPIYTPAAQSVIKMGFSKKAVKMALDVCSTKGQRWNADTLAEILLEKQTAGEVLPTDSPRPESPLSLEAVGLEEDPISQKERLLSRIMCILCEVNQANSLFLPCAHHRMCVDCAQDVSVCPMCGKDVHEKIKTFMA